MPLSSSRKTDYTPSANQKEKVEGGPLGKKAMLELEVLVADGKATPEAVKNWLERTKELSSAWVETAVFVKWLASPVLDLLRKKAGRCCTLEDSVACGFCCWPVLTGPLGYTRGLRCPHCPQGDPRDPAWEAPAPGRPWQMQAGGDPPEWNLKTCRVDICCGQSAQNKAAEHMSALPEPLLLPCTCDWTQTCSRATVGEVLSHVVLFILSPARSHNPGLRLCNMVYCCNVANFTWRHICRWLLPCRGEAPWPPRGGVPHGRSEGPDCAQLVLDTT